MGNRREAKEQAGDRDVAWHTCVSRAPRPTLSLLCLSEVLERLRLLRHHVLLLLSFRR